MRKILMTAAVCVCTALCGCQNAGGEYKKTVFAMDTVMDLKIYSENDEPLLKAEEEIKRLDAVFDRGNENSDIYRINKNKSAAVSDETAEIIRKALDISEMTDGAFDITTAPVTDLWGFYGGNFRVPSNEELNAALSSVGYKNIRLDSNKVSIPESFSLDLGGIGKGFASDSVINILRGCGVSSAIVSLGGNVQALGQRPDGEAWSVGITDPDDKSRLLGKVKVSDKAVITSGGYQRFFEKDGKTYHHIIDPKTGKSAESGLVSVTVIAESGALSDGLSTALFVAGLDKSAEIWHKYGGFDAVFAENNGNIYVTEGIADTFECDRPYSVLKK